jgi:hypothetical protein
MHKALVKFRALIVGELSIDFVDKTPIKRTPGDTTEMAHN